jgi:putative MFS transporter
MAQDTSGTGPVATGGAAPSSTALVVPGEIAARIDRLPASWVQWELALLTQVAWGIILSTDGIARTLYPFIWEPGHFITSFQYSVIYAFQVGIGILIGDYVMGWLADKIGRRPTMLLSAVLAGIFIWPFGYVTNYPLLVLLSIFVGLGVGGILATNVVYMTEMTSPAVRGKMTLGSQVLAIIIFSTILVGLVPHYMIPGNYRAYLFLLGGLQIFVLLPLLAWRLPESPRWLEARGRIDEARRLVEKMEARCRKRHPVLPEPDLSPHEVVTTTHPGVFAVFQGQYAKRTVFLLLIWVLGYGGIVYGAGAYGYVFLTARGYGAGFVFALTAWSGVVGAAILGLNALVGERIERKTAIIAGSILFAGCWFGLYNVHNTVVVVILYMGATTGTTLWLWNMYVYTPNVFPTRMRAIGTGWTDGVGHIGAWGGVIIAGMIFTAASPLGWILLITLPGALVPGGLIGAFGLRQRRAVLEKLSR